ncbi:hypothetical protein GQR58_006732 [Nymphon striatum]|nr:hypothetical protein GQR58_006732 [Nymphon striatum]
MGGFGALRMVSYYVDSFSSISAISSPILSNESKESKIPLLVRLYFPLNSIFGPQPYGGDKSKSIHSVWTNKNNQTLQKIRLQLIWGDKDQPNIIKANQRFHELLLKSGRKHQYHVYQGGHNWESWQPNFNRVINFLLNEFVLYQYYGYTYSNLNSYRGIMATLRKPGPIINSTVMNNSSTVTNCHLHNYYPGSVNGKNFKSESDYTYSISGKVGALGNMLFTEMSQRFSGTLYDYTLATTEFREQEAELGLSEYGDSSFKKMAKETLKNLKSPEAVDVNIHFETTDRVEEITVLGSKGVKFFTFDLNEFEKNAKQEEGFKPINEIIENILSAVRDVR